MKISEMTTDQAGEVLARIADPVGRIMADDEAMEIFKGAVSTGTDNALKGWGQIITKLVPFCLKKHKEDLYEVVAALDFKSVDEVGGWKFLTTVKVLTESFDRDLISFLRSIGGAKPADSDK